MRTQLIELRKNHGLTQKQVADYLGKSRTTYTQYETGASNPSFEVIVKLKTLFDYPCDDIFLLTDVKKIGETKTSA